MISFGDGTRPVRNALTAVHRYGAAGSYRITVHCASMAGNAAVDHILVHVR